MKGSSRGTKAQLLLRVVAIYSEVILHRRETEEDEENKKRLSHGEFESPILTDISRRNFPTVTTGLRSHQRPIFFL